MGEVKRAMYRYGEVEDIKLLTLDEFNDVFI